MPYITREDGERFIIPSYRDTLSVKKPGLLKKEVTILSANYGEYITLQKKNVTEYEIAFSPDSGYLLGECVWHYFKRPYDMIYCEAIPNSNEAILVIVKSGSVYLDGSFPVDSIPEELVIFKTQQNNFSIFIYGDVPISQTPEDGKFSFDASSVKSFSVLDAPVFPTLPGVKAFQLQLVDNVLKSQGIGVLPIKQVAIGAAVLFVIWAAYEYISTHQQEIATVVTVTAPTDPYEAFNNQLITPDPEREIQTVLNNINLLNTIPGWFADSVDYTPGFPASLRAHLKSSGARTQILMDWVAKNNLKLEILPDGIYLTILSASPKRPIPTTISHIQDIIATVLDNLSYVLPGNTIAFTAIADKKVYKETNITVTVADNSPFIFNMVGESLEGLPLVLSKLSIKISDDGNLSGTIIVRAIGN
jgi:hypothetical protein